MVNKPFRHIRDFALASYTFGCVKMSDFMPNNHHLRKVLIFFFHSKKTTAEAHRQLQKVYGDAALSETTCCDWFPRFKDGDFDVDDRKYEQKHEKVILQHDNARPHVAKPVKTCLETFKWKVPPYPPYFPDIAPSDSFLFRSMAHGLADQQFCSYEDIEKWLDSWIASKD